MSHIPGRKEKDCLNCGTIVAGRYCQHCGQENVVPKETFWHMVTHFFYDIFHFDGQFFHTLRILVMKPGFLTGEYMKGRRASYVHPIKMYVFSSAIFFLLFFAFFKPNREVNEGPETALTSKERAEYIITLQRKLEYKPNDADLTARLNRARDTTQVLTQKDTYLEVTVVDVSGKSYQTKEEYDSIQQTLPRSERDGWLMRRIEKRAIDINNKFRHDPDKALDKLLDGVLHRLPYMLFLSLPLFALILKLVYIRRKQFYVADHGVFTLHLYVFSFMALLAVFLLDALQDWLNFGLISYLIFFVFVGLWIYLFAGMKRFYGQKAGKTFIKFLLVTVLSLLMMVLLFLGFLIFSAATL